MPQLIEALNVTIEGTVLNQALGFGTLGSQTGRYSLADAISLLARAIAIDQSELDFYNESGQRTLFRVLSTGVGEFAMVVLASAPAVVRIAAQRRAYSKPLLCNRCSLSTANLEDVYVIWRGGVYCANCIGGIWNANCALCRRPSGGLLLCGRCASTKVPHCLTCHGKLTGPDAEKAGLCDNCAREGQWIPWREDVLRVMKLRPKEKLVYTCCYQCEWFKAIHQILMDAWNKVIAKKVAGTVRVTVPEPVKAALVLLHYAPTVEGLKQAVSSPSLRRDVMGGRGCYHPVAASPLIGVELELYAKTKDTRLALRNAVADFAILKFDRSISEKQGAEIVTVPMTLEEHYVAWKPVFDGIIQKCSVDGTCGLHTHLDRIGKATSVKIAKFITRPLNDAFIETIAGREENGFCFKAPSLSWRRIMQQARDHHAAISLGAGRNSGRTDEFRIFASTTNFTAFMARLEFTVALSHFARNHNKMLHDDFTWWLRDKPYPYLKWLLGLREKEPTALPALRAMEKRKLVLGIKRGLEDSTTPKPEPNVSTQDDREWLFVDGIRNRVRPARQPRTIRGWTSLMDDSTTMVGWGDGAPLRRVDPDEADEDSEPNDD